MRFVRTLLLLVLLLGGSNNAGATANFPATLDDNSTLFTLVQGDVYVAKFHNNPKDAILALEAKVGVNSSATATSIDYLLKNTASIDPGHKHSSGSMVSPLDISVRDKGGAVYNVGAYGVKCDGSTDDRPAMQALLDSVSSGRAHFVFPAGICHFAGSLKWAKATRSGVIGIGAILEGAGAGATILDYTGSSWLFVINDATGTDNAANIEVRNVGIRLHGAALGAFVLNDPAITSNFHDLDIQGAGTTGIGILLHGELSCVCHNTFSNIKFSSLDKNIQLSGFANANDIRQIESVTTNSIGFDFEPIGANAVCGASGEPYSCCTGSGTGSSAGACAADTSGGDDNLIERSEFATGVALGIKLDSQSSRNLFEKIVCDGATACVVNNVAAPGTTFINSALNPDPTGAGRVTYINTAYSGNDSTIDTDLNMGGSWDLKSTSGGSRAYRITVGTSNPMVKVSIASGADGDEMRFDAGTGTSTFASFFVNAAEIFRAAATEVLFTKPIREAGVVFASLGTPTNGTIQFCTNCDPASAPCSTGGASTGSFALRMNGAWKCL